MLPALLILILAYFVASLFLSIFSFSSTAILHAFIADRDTGGGATTPAALLKFVEWNAAENAKAKGGAAPPAAAADPGNGPMQASSKVDGGGSANAME